MNKTVAIILSSRDVETGGELYMNKMMYAIRDIPISVKTLYITDLIKITCWIKNYRLKNLFDNLLIAWKWAGHYDCIVDNHFHNDKLSLFKTLQRIIYNSRQITFVMHFDYYPTKYYQQFWQRCYFNINDSVVTISQTIKKQIVALGVRPNKVKVIPPSSVDIVDVTNKIKPIDKIHLLYVGHLYPRKGLLELLSAIVLLKDKPIVLDVIGSVTKDPGYVRRVNDFIAENHLEKIVLIHGRVDNVQLQHYYKMAAIFVMPSLIEGFGIVLLEAMQHSLPIVANNLEVLNELIISGKNGLIADIQQAQDFANAISTLLDDPVTRRDMGIWGFENILPLFSWDISELEFKRLVLSILGM